MACRAAAVTEALSLRQRATLVEALSSSLEHGGAALGTVPKALRRLLEQGAWREFTTSRGEHVTHERFADFVTTAPLKGLGSDIALVERIVADDDSAAKLLRSALKGTNNISTRARMTEHGTRRDYAIERLERDAPELHEEVLAGNLSAHAAMVQAGFRPKTVSVPVTRPEAVAKALRKHMTPSDLASLIAYLGDRN